MDICNKNTNSKKSPGFFISLLRIAEFPKVVKDSECVGEESSEGSQEWLLHPEKNVEGAAYLLLVGRRFHFSSPLCLL